MSEPPQLAEVRRIYERWAVGDFAASMPLLAERAYCTWEEPMSVIVCHSRDAARRRFGDFLRAWGDYRVELLSAEALDEERVLVHALQLGSGRQSGAETSADAWQVWRFAGGEVVELHWYFARADALRAAGVEAG